MRVSLPAEGKGSVADWEGDMTGDPCGLRGFPPADSTAATFQLSSLILISVCFPKRRASHKQISRPPGDARRSSSGSGSVPILHHEHRHQLWTMLWTAISPDQVERHTGGWCPSRQWVGRSSRAAAELALEGDLAGAMPSWRRMAMDMRGPSASSVSARLPRCMRSGLCSSKEGSSAV